MVSGKRFARRVVTWLIALWAGAVLFGFAAGAAGFSEQETSPAARPAAEMRLAVEPSATPSAAIGEKGGEKMKINLTSEAFRNGKRVPVDFTGDGQDVSPPLLWSGVPEETAELALIVDDPDAPSAEPWVHWVIYKIPPAAQGLPQGVSPDRSIKGMESVLQGKNSWGAIGYRGPSPPRGHGVHHYYFRLYAIDRALPLRPGMDKKSLLHAISDHSLAVGELMGTYERK